VILPVGALAVYLAAYLAAYLNIFQGGNPFVWIAPVLSQPLLPGFVVTVFACFVIYYVVFAYNPRLSC
jgi:hypothetical protein